MNYMGLNETHPPKGKLMPKTQTLTITKFSDKVQFIESVDEQYLYTKHKSAIKDLLNNAPVAIHKITITRHRFGLYYTYSLETIFMPAPLR